MKKVLFLTALVLILSACQVNQVPAEKQCVTDDDCVAASCCHPTEAVNVDYAPDCEGVFCTQECVPGTLDCGQGEIRCVSGECRAIIEG